MGRAVRQRHCVRGGALINFGRSWRRSAGGQKMFFKDSRKNSFYPQNFLVIENCNKISPQQQWHRRRADKLSAAARRSTEVGGANKLLATNCWRRIVDFAITCPTDYLNKRLQFVFEFKVV